MANAIEQAKREMYQYLEQIKKTAAGGFTPNYSIRMLEPALESYLELLRQDHEALHETARKRFEDIQALEMKNDAQREIIEGAGGTNELSYRLAKMTEERDAIQLRLHAVGHAYNEQQRRGATQVSNSGENVSCATLDGKAAAIVGAVVDCQRIVTDWSLEGLKAKEAMRLIFFAVMAPTINSALYELESKK